MNGREPAAAPVGRVIGSGEAAYALEFWVWVEPDCYLQLDDVVTVPVELPDGQRVDVHGVVDQVRSRYEGGRLDSDADLAARQLLPLDIANAAHVSVTRVEPEIFVAPFPGRPVYRSQGEQRNEALYFDEMLRAKTAFVAGLSRDNQPIYGNLEFLDGTRGAHMNISGVSGVATKTSYALFLLHALFQSEALREHASNTKAVVFNVKGQDLLWLDKKNNRLDAAARERYATLNLPAEPFHDAGFYAPVRKESDALVHDADTRPEGVTAYAWSLGEFCDKKLLKYLFADADSETSQLSFVVRMVEDWLADRRNVSPPDDTGVISITYADGTTNPAHSFHDLVRLVSDAIDEIADRAAAGTRQAFVRRLFDAAGTAGHLVRAIPKASVEKYAIRVLGGGTPQMTVIDIHRLPDRAKRFVVGVVVRDIVEQKEKMGSGKPLVFLVLDELNKYAPREASTPIKEVVLDIAERGRSLGVILIGAQQTASEVERRVTSNASFRVTGRLDPAEASRGEYGFLTEAARARSSILKPGSMFINQPEIPVPLLVQFPFPAWATRKDEVDEEPIAGSILRGKQ